MAVASPPTPKRKAGRSPKDTSNNSGEPNESGHRTKRSRRSIGGPAVSEKSQREQRAEGRLAHKFDGVILPSRRRSARHSPAQATQNKEPSNDGSAGGI